MTTQKLKKLVTEAVALDRLLNETESKLAAIKNALIAEASTREEEHTETAGGGWSWIAASDDGSIARVTQEGEKLKASISSDKDLNKAKTICGNLFHYLFTPKMSYRLTTDFRTRASELLGAADAKRLVKAFSSAGSVRVSYETKEVA